MRNGALVVVVAAFGVGAGGCNGAGKGRSPDLVMGEENNFTIDDASITFGHASIEQGANFCMKWSDVSTDIRGRPLVPSEVDQVLLVDFSIPEETLASRIVDDNYVPQEAATPWVFDNTQGATEACASDFGALGSDFQPGDETTGLFAGSSRTWLVSLANLREGNVYDILQTMVVEPGPTPPTDDPAVTFRDGATNIAIDPNLGSKPLKTAPDSGPYTLDWGGLDTDVNGRPWDNLVGDLLFVAHRDDTVADIEADFLLLDYHASELYELDVRGKTNASLDEAVSADGTAFPGFTTDGTWIVGIGCSSCISPIPLAIAVVQVAEE